MAETAGREVVCGDRVPGRGGSMVEVGRGGNILAAHGGLVVGTITSVYSKLLFIIDRINRVLNCVYQSDQYHRNGKSEVFR